MCSWLALFALLPVRISIVSKSVNSLRFRSEWCLPTSRKWWVWLSESSFIKMHKHWPAGMMNMFGSPDRSSRVRVRACVVAFWSVGKEAVSRFYFPLEGPCPPPSASLHVSRASKKSIKWRLDEADGSMKPDNMGNLKWFVSCRGVRGLISGNPHAHLYLCGGHLFLAFAHAVHTQTQTGGRKQVVFSTHLCAHF